MKPHILVQVWCEVDPTLNLRVDRESGMPVAEGGDVLTRVSPLGRFGLDSGLGIQGASVIAFAAGEGHEPALRHALASGAARAVQLTEVGEGAGSERPAQHLSGRADACFPSPAEQDGLAQWVRDQSPALVIGDRGAGVLAGGLGWAHLAQVDELRLEGGFLRAVRELGRGDRERVHAVLPAVIGMAEGRIRLRYVSLDRVQEASRREVERVSLGDGVSRVSEPTSLQLARPRTRVGQDPHPAGSTGLDRMKALMSAGTAQGRPQARGPELAGETPEEMAEAFVRYLRHHELMERPWKQDA